MTDTTREAALAFYATVDAIAAGKGDASTLDTKTTEDFAAHLPGQDAIDRDGFKAVVLAFASGFPGATHDIEDVVVSDDRAALRLVWTAVHTGEFQGAPATGNTIQMNETGFLRVVDGRVAELWPLFDTLELMTGSGVLESANRD